MAPKPVPMFIFLFILTISSVSPIYFSFSSSLYIIILSAACFSNYEMLGLSSSYFVRQDWTTFFSYCEYCSGSVDVNSLLTIFFAKSKGLVPVKGGRNDISS